VLNRASFVVLLAAAALTACGDGDSAAPATTQTSARPAPVTTTAVAGQEQLPEQPQIALDFGPGARSEVVVDRSGRARVSAGALALALRAAGAARARPREQPPHDARTTLVIARIDDPRRLGGRAGIFCRGDHAGGGYELTLDRAGDVRLDRSGGGRRTTLARGRVRLDAASPPDSPVPLLLVCGRGDERTGPHVVFTVGAQEAAGVRDPSPRPPGSGARTGMLVGGDAGDRARFTVFTTTYGP
jgi:hypothetical protein